MKNIISIALILFMTLGCNDTKEVVEQKHKDGSAKVVSVYKNERILSQTEYYENGQMKITGLFDESGNRHGMWKYWYDNGNLWSECEYENGTRNGLNATYYENGNKRFSGNYKNGRKTGKWSFWKEDGSLVTEREM